MNNSLNQKEKEKNKTIFIYLNDENSEDNKVSISYPGLNETPDFYKSLIGSLEKIVEKEGTNEELLSFQSIFPYSDLSDHLICKKCFKSPIIQIISFYNINYSCDCKDANMSMEDLLKKDIVHFENEKEDEIKFCLKCNKHKKKFCYYCKSCNLNMCRKCLSSNSLHTNHTFFIFDEFTYEINKKIEKILMILGIGKDEKKNDNNSFDSLLLTEKLENNIIDNFIRFISIIINDFRYYPNYSYFEIITNVHQFLNKFIKNKKNSNEINNFELNEQLKIYNLKDFNQNIACPEQIIFISLNNSDLIDITPVCQPNLINLENLELRGNNIVSIKPLLFAKFKLKN